MALGRELQMRIERASSKTPYPPAAFQFVLQAAPISHAPVEWRHHVDAAEYCWKLRDMAINEFGAGALEQLNSWSIFTCEDLGVIVYGLIDEGLITRTESDRIEDFHEVFQFSAAFAESERSSIRGRPQWRISTLLIFTTLAAIAMAGYAGNGLEGAVQCLFASWLILIGGFAVSVCLRGRRPGQLLGLCSGLLFLALGLAVFILIILKQGDKPMNFRNFGNKPWVAPGSRR